MKNIPDNIPLGIYRHFKGNEYELIAIARDSEDPDRFFAVYRALYGDSDVWVRPLDMFCEKVVRDGKVIPRFSYVG